MWPPPSARARAWRVSLRGDSHTYTWADKTPTVREGDRYHHFGSEPEERPVIMRGNTKSHHKPFQIFETTNRFTIFGHEHRKGFSRFPWWNHWPVAQVPSDGRYCQAADRASHFSLAWGGPPPTGARAPSGGGPGCTAPPEGTRSPWSPWPAPGSVLPSSSSSRS